MIEKNSHSISNNSVRVINEDKQGNLWIGTNYGLNKFNPKQKSLKFTRWKMDCPIILYTE